MKRFAAVLAATVAAATLGTAPAAAQVVDMKVDVPFDFYVAGERMPAGTYTVENFPHDISAPRMHLLVERADPVEGEPRFVTIPTLAVEPTDPDEGPRLVFERVGEANLLVKVIPADGDVRRVGQ